MDERFSGQLESLFLIDPASLAGEDREEVANLFVQAAFTLGAYDDMAGRVYGDLRLPGVSVVAAMNPIATNGQDMSLPESNRPFCTLAAEEEVEPGHE